MTDITKELVSRLIANQFPQWSDLPITPVEKSGNDNRTFRLGSEMSVRLPSKECYVPQVEKELYWLPKLQPQLSLPISAPIAKGDPAAGYPWPWSVNKWLEGESANHENISNLNQFAIDLAGFLKELQAIPSDLGPIAGAHNFYRGGSLTIYDAETKTAMSNLKSLVDINLLSQIWEAALESTWEMNPVWVHGDIAPGNLLVNEGRLCAVIDFGILGVGDPACDLAMAWTFYDDESRETLYKEMQCDEGTWDRARGWALWKALITYDRNDQNSEAAVEAKHTIDVIVNEYKRAK